MSKNRLIIKSTSCLLIGVMVYMHVCSAWCALVPGRGCCNQSGREGSERTCCSHQQDANHNESGCQDFHLAFFKATGQFFAEQHVAVVQVIPFILFAYPNPVFQNYIEQRESLVAFNNYHPPPAILDIRMFIHSFQI